MMRADIATRGQLSPQPLSVRNLTVAYDGKPAVTDVSFDAAPGRLVAIVGPNGAGKSTLIKSALGLVAHAGHVRIFGLPVEAARPRIAYVPQRASVDWDFPASALDVVAMGLYRKTGWFRPLRRRHAQAARRALGEVGMEDYAERPIGALSGGQQQRVFFARALVQDADLLFLDEPFAGVDATTENVIFARLGALRDAGKTIIAVHHDLDTVSGHFDDVVLLNRTLIASGTVADVFTPQNLTKAYGGVRAGLLGAAGA